MNQEERKEFWSLLCSFTGNEISSEKERLRNIINKPTTIYRYRAVNLNTIDSLQRNRVFFSNADYYDDPFDTLLQIDFDRVRKEGVDFFSSNTLKQRIQHALVMLNLDEKYADSLYSIVCNTDTDRIIDFAINTLKQNIQGLLRRRHWTACFTEDGDSENMWLKYADQYKGFCLVYDLQDLSKDLCGKQEKCANCVINQAGTELYPVFYSDDGYDATDYAKNLFLQIMIQVLLNNQHFGIESVNQILSNIPNQVWQIERVSLIKSKCHEYDREWRLLLQGESNTSVMKEWIPDGVILGLRMSGQNRDLVIRSSKQAGINHIYESYINDKYKIDHREIAS